MNLRITAVAAVAILAVVAIAQKKYIVTKGDTLGGIAAKTGSNAKSLASYNGIKSNKALQIGAKLLIPTSRKSSVTTTKVNKISTPKVRVNAQDVVIRSGASTTAKKVTTAAKGSEAWVIGKKGAWYNIKFANGVKGYVRGDFLNAAKAGSAAKLAVNSKRTYKVVSGDSDVRIAKKFGVSEHALRVANPGIKWSRLQIGKTITIPSTSKTITKLAKGERINWIDTSSVKVNRDAVVIRRGPSTKSEKITVVDAGTKATVLGRSGAWYKLRFARGAVGFVRGDYLNEVKRVSMTLASHKSNRSNKSYSTNRRTYSSKRSTGGGESRNFAQAGPGNGDIVSEAQRYLGTRYRWGGQSTRGFDCSGFVRYVYRNSTGVTLPRTSREQAKTGAKVSRNQLRPGDLISFSSRGGGSRVNHSGIYVGNNKFIHASSGKGRVVVSELSGHYAKRYVAAHRPAGSKAAVKKPAVIKKPVGPDTEPVKVEAKPADKVTENPAEKAKEEVKKGDGK